MKAGRDEGNLRAAKLTCGLNEEILLTATKAKLSSLTR